MSGPRYLRAGLHVALPTSSACTARLLSETQAFASSSRRPACLLLLHLQPAATPPPFELSFLAGTVRLISPRKGFLALQR